MAFYESLQRCLPPSLIRWARKLKSAKGRLILIPLGFRAMIGLPGASVCDDTWFELQFRPQAALKYTGIPVPTLPPDEVQMRFTGSMGRNNLRQAFSFYKYTCSVCNLKQINQPKILDFGGGWGRISRFFLRESKPEFIWIADCLSDSIHWLHATRNPCNIIMNDPLPPIPGLHTSFDLIYAFSVFSHLSEESLHAWLTYLMDCLAPSGYLVFTTRGNQFIEQIEHIYQENEPHYLKEKLPHPEEIRARHLRGELQFYPTGGGGELTSDFYGETLIPRSYIEMHYGSALVSFTEEIEDVDQAVVVLVKTKG
jgi:hypothetical protein